MFRSFFPRPKLCFLTAIAWTALSITFWYSDASELTVLLGFANADRSHALTAASWFWSAQSLWFDVYFAISAGLFAGCWRLYSPHPWSTWSILGSALILFAIYFQ